ncbi:putative TetR family transcriptional regulator [Caenibius tardaugens NBRC 16725]|uniref:Putative TetR family transcriptional regulator n=1 Tax=Caenibius tardaugens NBRC 16725 TaxID=1219035 RepID=U2YPB8_9SPHN|nr:TetR/AcrR family transcriptional regulator [Caenibius tardaugens]GAD50492.1 putative TetR family transcriptional regulator [Caenibius tardaugens NBRC 16725]
MSREVAEARKTSTPHVSWQSKKREANREQILEAALNAFEEKSYGAVTVEDIIEKAKVSRATFYKHFPNKLAIVVALSQGKVSPIADQAYAKLARLQDPTARQLSAWVRQFVAIFENNRAIIETLAEVWIVEPEYHEIMVNKHELNIKMLGESIPAFAVASSGLKKDEYARIKAHFLLRLLEDFCNSVTIHKWDIEKDVGIRVISDEFYRFIQDFG